MKTALEKDFEKTISNALHVLPGSIPYSREYKINIKKKYEGLTLPSLYEQAMPHIEEDWNKKITSGEILLEGRKSTLLEKVKAGQITSRTIGNITEPFASIDLKLIHLEEDFWILNKPSPLPMHPAGRFNKNTLSSFLQIAFPEKAFHLVHRLDANTTGVIIIALNKKTASYFINAFSKKEIQKEYLALVKGNPKEDIFTLNDSIGKNTEAGGSRKLEQGHMAETKVEVLTRYSNHALLKVSPSTGRTNQIRIHLAKNNLPIVGDIGYEDDSYFKSNPMTYNEDCLFLHAHKITFKHPVTQERTTFTAERPIKFDLANTF